jgi:signal transduction histidine kinase
VRRHRRLLLRAEDFFGRRPPIVVLLMGVVTIAAVGFLDHVTGPTVSVSLFYLVPIGIVTWNLGRWLGLLAVVLAGAAELTADVLDGPSGDLIPYWNGAVLFVLFLMLALLLATFRQSIERQKRQVDAERGVSDSLRELNEMKNTLLHAVSHDLKAPIAAIVGSAGTLRRAEQLQLTPGEREELLEAIDASGRKMNRLVEDLLDLDRIDRGDLQPELAMTDVGDLARRVVRECEVLGARPVRVEADHVLAEVDAAKVERILENLLVNAARHTPVGTPIRIGVRGRADGLVVTVEDEGPGVPDDMKESVFDPFRQGPGSKGGGVGIGLSLVKRFAELHGGTARIEDTPGGGARFVIVLPARVASRDTLTPRGDQRLRVVGSDSAG